MDKKVELVIIVEPLARGVKIKVTGQGPVGVEGYCSTDAQIPQTIKNMVAPIFAAGDKS